MQKIKVLEFSNQWSMGGTEKTAQLLLKHLNKDRFEVYAAGWKGGPRLPIVEKLAADVASRGKKLTHVAVRWVLDQPAITSAIVGASSADQLRDSLGCLQVKLDDADRRACDQAWYAVPRRSPEEEQ